MAILCRLPNELVLLIIEHACRGFNYTQPAWVALLCLVCKSVQLTVVPILYARLFISAKTILALEQLSCTDKNRRLSLVREVHIHETLYPGEDTLDGGCVVRNAFSSTLARVLNGTHTICGPSWSLELLAHLNPDLSATISSSYVTDPPVVWRSMEESKCLSALLASVARLHILEFFTSLNFVVEKLAPLRGIGTTLNSLVFDIALSKDDIIHAQPEDLTQFHATLDFVMEMLPSCRRFLFRPRCELSECAHWQHLIAQLTTWARGRKDARIWADDAFVSIRNATTGEIYYLELDVSDVLAGDSLWERGRPLWTPQTRMDALRYIM